MKRMLITAVSVAAATAAFAAPASAQTSIALAEPETAVAVTCTKPLVECARDLALWAADPRNAVNLAFNTVIYAGNVFDDVCDATLGTCNVTP